MWSLYGLGIRFFGFISSLTSLFNPKIRHWRDGRLQQSIKSHSNPILIHCSSLGEYLQAKPLINLLKGDNKEVVLSFFSPSGFDKVHDYDKYYLPIDTYKKANEFIKSISPSLVILVRSEYWFNHLRVLNETKTPVIVMNSFLSKDHYFFKSFGRWFLNQIKRIDFFYTLDEQTHRLLKQNGITNTIVTGDTKVDQVTNEETQEHFIKLSASNKIILAGSVEKEDRPCIKQLIEKYSEQCTIIIVPHEPSEDSFNYYQNITNAEVKKYSDKKLESANIIYVDIHGVLSSLYNIAWVSYIGGGFGKGIHNILEACITECPMIFGPNHRKFPEAEKLIILNAARQIKNQKEINTAIDYFALPENYAKAQGACKEYIIQNQGATIKLYNHLKHKGFI